MTTPLNFADKPLSFPPPYLLFGEETQMLEEMRAAIRREFAAENTERADLDELPTSPLLRDCGKGLFGGGAPQLAEVVGYAAPNKEEQDALIKLTDITKKNGDTLLVILHNLEYRHQKTAWFEKLAAAATAVQARRQTPAEAMRWLRRWAAEANAALSDDAAELLLTQTEGNLAPAKQALTKLSLAEAAGDAAGVRAALADGAQYDIFDLTDAVLSGKGSRAVKILRHLRAAGVADPLLLWSATSAVLNLVSLKDGKPPRMRYEQLDHLRSLAGRTDDKKLRALLCRAAYADRVCKGVATGDAETALTSLVIRLAALRRGVKIRLPQYQP